MLTSFAFKLQRKKSELRYLTIYLGYLTILKHWVIKIFLYKYF